MSIDPTTGDTFYEGLCKFLAPVITASVVSKGVVIGYYGYPTSAGDTLMFDEAEFGSFAEMSVTTGNIEIDAIQDLSFTSSSGYLFRYVIIPGNVLVTSFNGMTCATAVAQAEFHGTAKGDKCYEGEFRKHPQSIERNDIKKMRPAEFSRPLRFLDMVLLNCDGSATQLTGQHSGGRIFLGIIVVGAGLRQRYKEFA